MDSFYVTLPSNASFDVYPDNKKSNYTTQFNTPLVLDGNYEVALAHITCTPNIRNDYGQIIIKNYLDQLPNFVSNQNFNFLKHYNNLFLDLYAAKNLEDKINNDIQQFIYFHQLVINSLIFSIIHNNNINWNTKDPDITIPVFYDISNVMDQYYIPQNYSNNLDTYIPRLNDAEKFTFSNRWYMIEKNIMFEFIPKEFKTLVHPYHLGISTIFDKLPPETNHEFIKDLIIAFKNKQLNRLDEIIPLLFTKIFNFFDSIYHYINYMTCMIMD